MNKSYFDLLPEEQLNLLRVAEDKLGLSPTIIEKDLWLCWLLKELFALPLKMAFKGGTSLSKVFGLINRFSEDVDISIDYRNFVNELNLKQASRSQIKKINENLKVQMEILAHTKIVPHLKKQTLLAFPNYQIDITLTEDGEKLRYFYPTLLKNNSGYLRDHVLIEFGIRNSSEPCDRHIISPFLSVIDQSIIFPQPSIETLSPIRTFWEKATLIHVECNRKRLIQSPERLSRHWYDLFMLSKSWVGEEAFIQRNILQNVIQHKTALFNASYAHYDRCLNGNFRLIPDEPEQKHLEKDYRQMRKAGMFLKTPPEFDQMIQSLHQLELRCNDKEIWHEPKNSKDSKSILDVFFCCPHPDIE